MKRILMTGAAGLAVVCLAGSVVQSEGLEERVAALENKVKSSISYDLGVFSKYIWRGINLSEDPVCQANIGISQGNLSGGIFGNYQTGDVDRLTELDITLDYGASAGIVGMNIGYILYTFPNVPAGAGRESAEIYVAAGIDTIGSPSMTVYYDYDQGDGTYCELGFSHGYETAGVGIEPSVALGFNDHQWRAVGSSFTNLDPGLSLSYGLGPVGITANWVYSFGLDKDHGYGGDHGWGGLNLSMAF